MSTRKNLALREAVPLFAQALVLLSKQFTSILGCTPTLGKTVDQVNSHLRNTNQRIVVLSESKKCVNGIKESLLLGYCLSELMEMPGEQSGNARKYGIKVWDLFIEKEHRARKLSSFLLVKALILHGLETKVAPTLVTPPAMFLANASANKLYRSFGYRSVQGVSTQLINGVEQVKAAVANALSWYETGGGKLAGLS